MLSIFIINDVIWYQCDFYERERERDRYFVFYFFNEETSNLKSHYQVLSSLIISNLTYFTKYKFNSFYFFLDLSRVEYIELS